MDWGAIGGVIGLYDASSDNVIICDVVATIKEHGLQIIRQESYLLQCPSEANDRLSAARSHHYSEKLHTFHPEIRRRTLRHPGEWILGALAYFEPKHLVLA